MNSPSGDLQATIGPFQTATPQTLFAANANSRFGVYFLIVSADAGESISMGDSDDPVNCANMIKKLYVAANTPVVIPIPGGIWAGKNKGILVKTTGTANVTVTGRAGKVILS